MNPGPLACEAGVLPLPLDELTVNEGKSKVMRIGKNGEENEVNVSLNERRMEEVETYRYLGWIFRMIVEWVKR